MMRALRLVAAAFLAAVLTAMPELRDLPVRASVPLSGPVAGVPGRWLYVTYTADGRSLLRTIEPSTKSIKDLVVFPVGSYVGGPAAAPDGRRVAHSVFRTGAPGGADPGGADLFVMDADGSHPRMVLAHDRPGVSLGQPAWTPDGRALLFVRATPDGRTQIERVPAAGGASQVVVTDADSPTAASPGRMAFLRIEPASNAPSLWIAAAAGRFARPLVNQPAFLAMASPRFSPDGRRIAFAAAYDPGRAPRRSESRRRAFVAWAHGLPMDIWVVAVDGTGLRQLTELGEDDPVPAWSSDGRWLAFSGAFGVYLLGPDRRDVRLVHDDVSSGLTWLPR
jgi:Tol biopolymer transport system component